jgi:signal transduction histidine kinase
VPASKVPDAIASDPDAPVAAPASGHHVHIEVISTPRDRHRHGHSYSYSDPGLMTIRVIDDGPGMSEERKASAFHRYGHPEPRGNGLGLAIVHRLAAANGGRAELRDTPGGGLTVDLEWPLNEP